MGFLNNMGLLLATSTEEATNTLVSTAYETFIGIVNIIMPVLIAAILVFGLFYGIKLGINYAKAEEDDAKKKAKDSLINVVVGCLIIVAFTAIVYALLASGFVKKLFPPDKLQASDLTK